MRSRRNASNGARYSARIRSGRAPADSRKRSSSYASDGVLELAVMSRALARADEVDEAALDVGVDELHPDAVADVEPLEAAHELALDRRLEDADPGPLLGRAGHDGVEPL